MSTTAHPQAKQYQEGTVYLVQSRGWKKQVSGIQRKIRFHGGRYTEMVDDPAITHVLINSVFPASQPGPDAPPQDNHIEAWSGRALVKKFTSEKYAHIVVVNAHFFELCKQEKRLLGENDDFGGMRIKSYTPPPVTVASDVMELATQLADDPLTAASAVSAAAP